MAKNCVTCPISTDLLVSNISILYSWEVGSVVAFLLCCHPMSQCFLLHCLWMINHNGYSTKNRWKTDTIRWIIIWRYATYHLTIQIFFMLPNMSIPQTVQMHCSTRWSRKWEDDMMTSSNGNIFHVTGPLCGEFTSDQWVPRIKASDTELWCFLLSARLNRQLSKQWIRWWFEIPPRSLWRHCNDFRCFTETHRACINWSALKYMCHCLYSNLNIKSLVFSNVCYTENIYILITITLKYCPVCQIYNKSAWLVDSPHKGQWPDDRWIPLTKGQ